MCNFTSSLLEQDHEKRHLSQSCSFNIFAQLYSCVGVAPYIGDTFKKVGGPSIVCSLFYLFREAFLQLSITQKINNILVLCLVLYLFQTLCVDEQSKGRMLRKGASAQLSLSLRSSPKHQDAFEARNWDVSSGLTYKESQARLQRLARILESGMY